MPKRAKKTPSTCEQHLFILKPKHSFCRFGQTATVSFCDPGTQKNKGRGKKCRNCQTLDCPIFNNDRNFATPTFILNSQKQYYDQRGIKMREQHQRKMIEYTDEKDSLNIPKPRTRNNFCSVCRQVYQDYLQHIDSQKHKKKINASLFNKYILDVAQKFNPTPKNIFTYSYPTLSTRDEEQLELLEMGGRPMKKVKSDHEIVSQRGLGYGQQKQGGKQQQIMPPPHLNLSNSAYFPGLGTNMPSINYFPNPYQYHQQMAPQMTFNYNMNFFWPPTYYNPHQSYGMINPWYGPQQTTLDFLPTMNSINSSNFQQQQKIQQQQQLHYSMMMNNKYMQKIGEEKKQILGNKDSIIIIDDDQQGQYEHKQYNVA